MRYIVIPADSDEPIREVASDEPPLRALQQLVDGFIEVTDPFERADVTSYVNDDGKFTKPRNDRATVLCAPVLFADDYVAGPLAIAGFDPATGETVDLPADVTVEWIEARIAEVPGMGVRNPTFAEHARANPGSIVVDGTAAAPPLYPPEQ